MPTYVSGHEQMLEHSNVRMFAYVTFVSRFFTTKHSSIILMPDLCANFIQKVTLFNSGRYLFEVLTIKLPLH